MLSRCQFVALNFFVLLVLQGLKTEDMPITQVSSDELKHEDQHDDPGQSKCRNAEASEEVCESKDELGDITSGLDRKNERCAIFFCRKQSCL